MLRRNTILIRTELVAEAVKMDDYKVDVLRAFRTVLPCCLNAELNLWMLGCAALAGLCKLGKAADLWMLPRLVLGAMPTSTSTYTRSKTMLKVGAVISEKC